MKRIVCFSIKVLFIVALMFSLSSIDKEAEAANTLPFYNGSPEEFANQLSQLVNSHSIIPNTNISFIGHNDAFPSLYIGNIYPQHCAIFVTKTKDGLVEYAGTFYDSTDKDAVDMSTRFSAMYCIIAKLNSVSFRDNEYMNDGSSVSTMWDDQRKVYVKLIIKKLDETRRMALLTIQTP